MTEGLYNYTQNKQIGWLKKIFPLQSLRFSILSLVLAIVAKTDIHNL